MVTVPTPSPIVPLPYGEGGVGRLIWGSVLLMGAKPFIKVAFMVVETAKFENSWG